MGARLTPLVLVNLGSQATNDLGDDMAQSRLDPTAKSIGRDGLPSGNLR